MDEKDKLKQAEEFIEMQERIKKLYADKSQHINLKPPQTDKLRLK